MTRRRSIRNLALALAVGLFAMILVTAACGARLSKSQLALASSSGGQRLTAGSGADTSGSAAETGGAASIAGERGTGSRA